MGSTSTARRAAALAAVGLTLVLVLVGCTQRNSPVGTYRVTEVYVIEDGEMLVHPILPGTSITLTFTADGKLDGRACNSFGGSWARAGQGFRITGLYSTDMACSEPAGVMAQEQRFLDRLDEAGTVKRQGRNVTFGGPGEPSEVLFAAEPT